MTRYRYVIEVEGQDQHGKRSEEAIADEVFNRCREMESIEVRDLEVYNTRTRQWQPI